MLYKNLLIFIKKRIHILLLLVVCIIILTSHIIYVSQTRQYPEMDEQHYMHMAVQFYRLLQHPEWNTSLKIFQTLPFRQPGYSLLILPFLLIFGIEHSYQWALFVNGLLYVTTIVALYFLSREYLPKILSLITSMLFATYGWPLFYLHFTYSETATTTFVILSLLFLAKSNNLQDKKNCILFGVFLGLGLLTRWITPIFVAGPFLVTFINALKVKDRRNIINNLITIVVITVIIGIYPYIININAFWNGYIGHQLFGGSLWTVVPKERNTHLSLQSAAYYFKIFEQLTIYLFTIFIAGLVVILFKYKKYLFLLSAFTIPYIAFSFFTIIKDDRYIVPIYPIIALISIVTFTHIKKKYIRFILLTAIITISFFNFIGAYWGIGPLGKEGLQSILIRMPIGHPRRIHLATMVWPPTKEYSNADRIFTIIDNDINYKQLKDVNVVNFFYYHPVDNALYAKNNFNNLKPITFTNFVGESFTGKLALSNRLEDALLKADYVMIKTGTLTDNYFPPKSYMILNALIKTFNSNNKLIIENYTKIGTVKIPLDNSYVYIYRKKYIDNNNIKLFSKKVTELIKF